MVELNDHKNRAHALLSASSSARWLKCPPSAVAADMYPNQDTVFTREGTLAHEVAEATARRYLEGAPTPPVLDHPGVTSEMIAYAIDYADYIQELKRDDSAVVLLEQRLDFSPWVPDGFGTGDCLVIQGHRLDVVDYKYGQGVAVSAVDNTQMKLYGLGALHDFGSIYQIETVGLHIFQPRIGNVSVFEISAADLLAWGEEIKPTALLASEGKGNMCAGEHCRFCPHAGSCPALASTCLAMCGEGGVERPIAVPSLTPQEVADILAQEPMISAWLKAVKDRALSALLDGDEIPGYKVVEGRSSRGWADALEVEEILKREGGYAPEQYCSKPELLSVAQLEKAIGKARVAELLSGQILTRPGSPTVAPLSDKRKPFDRLAEARADFN